MPVIAAQLLAGGYDGPACGWPLAWPHAVTRAASAAHPQGFLVELAAGSPAALPVPGSAVGAD